MNCNRCGKNIPDNSTFCDQCGSQVITADYQPSAHSMEYCGVGIRFAALLIDSILFFIIGYVIAMFTGETTSSGFNLKGGSAFLLFSLVFVYYIALEGTIGATIGKKMLKIKIVKTDGSPCDFKASLIRNLLRIVDALPFYLIGAILIWKSPLKQRLGDKIAETVVIKC